MVVIIGNLAAKEYLKVEHALKQQNSILPPTLILYSLYAEDLVQHFENSSAILFEIPVVTSLVRLRQVLASPVVNVGVLYRRWNQDYIQRNINLAEKEGFKFHKILIHDNKPISLQLNAGLYRLKKMNVDAIWISGDNQLINVETLARSWIPRLRYEPISILTSLANLTDTRLSFANFSFSAKKRSLAVQAIDKILETIENNWSMTGITVEEPVAINAHLNVAVSKIKKIPVDKKSFIFLDKITP